MVSVDARGGRLVTPRGSARDSLGGVQHSIRNDNAGPFGERLLPSVQTSFTGGMLQGALTVIDQLSKPAAVAESPHLGGHQSAAGWRCSGLGRWGGSTWGGTPELTPDQGVLNGVPGVHVRPSDNRQAG